MAEVVTKLSTTTDTLHRIRKDAGFPPYCAVEIQNYHRCLELSEPGYYIYSGLNKLPPPPMIRSGHREAFLFAGN